MVNAGSGEGRPVGAGPRPCEGLGRREGFQTREEGRSRAGLRGGR